MLNFLKSLVGNNKGNFGEKPAASMKDHMVRHNISPLRKIDGSIDHRGHSGGDRTPSQKRGDQIKRK